MKSNGLATLIAWTVANQGRGKQKADAIQHCRELGIDPDGPRPGVDRPSIAEIAKRMEAEGA